MMTAEINENDHWMSGNAALACQLHDHRANACPCACQLHEDRALHASAALIDDLQGEAWVIDFDMGLPTQDQHR